MWLSRAPLFQACFGTSWRVGDDPRAAPLMSLSMPRGRFSRACPCAAFFLKAGIS